MAFKYTNQKGTDYYLHHSKNGPRTLYFFKREQGEGGLDEVPSGYTVSETSNGLPVLKKTGAEAEASQAGSGSKTKAGGETGKGEKATTGSRAKK
ncbi:MAG: hypothetical protein KIT87_02180 [Anaerolineae bacterium]|nr:hypothetical protein [Anaerolineae bacterium]